MSAVATLLAEMGHTVSGHDPSADSPFLGPLAALGVAVAAGGSAARRCPTASTPSWCPRPRPRTTRRSRRPGPGSIPVWHRSGALAAMGAGRQVVAVAGTHGKTTTSALAGHRPRRGRPPARLGGRGRHPRAWGAAPPGAATDPLVVEADESDGTFLALGARRPRSSPTSSPTTSSTGEASRLCGPPSCASWPPSRARPCSASTTPAPRTSSPRPRCRSPTAPTRPATTGSRPSSRTAPGWPSTWCTTASGSTWPCRLRRAPTTPATRPRRWPWPTSSACPLADGARAVGTFRGVARRFEVRGRGRRCASSSTATTTSRRGRRRAGRRPLRAVAPGRVLLPAPPLQPHRGPVAHLRRRLRRGRRAGRHRRLRRRGRPRGQASPAS